MGYEDIERMHKIQILKASDYIIRILKDDTRKGGVLIVYAYIKRTSKEQGTYKVAIKLEEEGVALFRTQYTHNTKQVVIL